MKKIYLILLVLIGMSISCTKNFEDFNTDKKHPTAVPGGFTFANAQKAMADQIGTTNVNLNIFKVISQYLTETTYTDEANYDIITRSIPDLTYRTWYRDVLNDLEDSKKSISAEEAIGVEALAIQKNRILIVDMVEVYVWQTLVDIFGNIPYTQALDIKNINPRYDDAYTIYKDLIRRINEDITGLDGNYGSFGSDDLFYNGLVPYGGDITMWKKFGNTMKVRLAIGIADADNTLAQNSIQEAWAGVFAPGENCQILYPGGSMANPIYLDVVATGRHDWVIANTIVDIMNPLADPRLPFYMTQTDAGVYLGGDYGAPNPYSQYSHLSAQILEETAPLVILDYTEVAFYLAEAAARTWTVGGTAESYYNAAIQNSILSWGGTQADVDAYLANPAVAYTTANGDYKQKIGTQAWIAFYMRGQEGWNEWRRLDFPTLNIPPTPETDNGKVPVRFTYPVNEQTLNKTSYYEAASAIGGDKMSTPIFWDKF
jgi:hypothetical protein